MHPVYTIGHSNLEWPAFVELLRQFKVGLVADVRSLPRSLRHPQFSQPEFEAGLREAGVGYLFLGEELGGRPEDPAAYRADGVVDYRARRQSRAFAAGIERVLAEAGRTTLALLCAEEDPLECHRFLMISPALCEAGAEPAHIRRSGSLESQRQAEDRLLERHHFGDVTSDALFASGRPEALEDAYAAQTRKCAFRVDPQTMDPW